MKKLRVVLASAAALALLCAAGCGGGDGGGTPAAYESPHDDKLVALVSAAANVDHIEDTNGILTVKVLVHTPDFLSLMEKHHAEAEQSASDGYDYERRLYELIYNDPAVKNTERDTVTIDLSMVNPEKTDWTKEEIEKLAQQQAFNEAADEFAMGLIQEHETYLEEVDRK